jgi:integral membrane protein
LSTPPWLLLQRQPTHYLPTKRIAVTGNGKMLLHSFMLMQNTWLHSHASGKMFYFLHFDPAPSLYMKLTFAALEFNNTAIFNPKSIMTNAKSSKLYSWFRKIAFAEGISFLLLLGIAMPLKYLANLPMAVRVMGALHGALFVAFVVLAWEVKTSCNRSFGWMAKALLASFLPFGTFVVDKEWKKEQASYTL